MKSTVSFVVEHGETTDTLQSFITVVQNLPVLMIRGIQILDYTVDVDLVDDILELLESDPWQGGHPS